MCVFGFLQCRARGAKLCLAAQAVQPQTAQCVVNSGDLLRSFVMKLPGGELAVVDLAKTARLLPQPRSPARAAQGARLRVGSRIDAADAVLLSEELRRAARERQAAEGYANEYGERYTVDFEFVRGGHRAMVRSAWIVRRGRLTSCFVLLD